ncbi:hypothetical protein NIES4072_64770 [Nostoc commune NIES-4072]|uniref:Uncharacterized protein n=1 Tax=Nostoc commune NIES-4072 TaxID=2005467 RepID=A0A2R5FWV4_NOSCO|nr:hypothetical protein [Nostoc commune]BBD70097.1 hypothetical protein NIES4070_65080 [Nostoc commune HK-02]GBG22765.1 hypothetical protein NIES4072_64770 [Nostoc commune NIES-4072]
MYQPQELFNNLSPSEISRTLRLSGIPEKELYTENDADRFRECRTLIEQGRNDEEVMALLSPVVDNALSETQGNSSSSTKNGGKKQGKKAQSPLDITELLVIARERGYKIALSQALLILQVCGLSEQDEYSPDECERFLETYKSIKEQNKSFEEVAASLTTLSKSENSQQLKLDAVIENVSEKAVAAREDLSSLIDKITAAQAEEAPELVQSLYLKNVALKLQQSDSENNLFAQLEERIMARIAQKKQQRAQLSGMNWETTPSLPSSPMPMLSPNVSKNGMNTD